MLSRGYTMLLAGLTCVALLVLYAYRLLFLPGTQFDDAGSYMLIIASVFSFFAIGSWSFGLAMFGAFVTFFHIGWVHNQSWQLRMIQQHIDTGELLGVICVALFIALVCGPFYQNLASRTREADDDYRYRVRSY